jgi:hypothetical protein
MNKVTVLERPSYQPTYRTYSSYKNSFSLLRDVPDSFDSGWESFTADSLPMYFSHGIDLLHKNIGQLEDIIQPYTEADEKSLLFMVESLIQARRLIEDVQLSMQ